MCYGKGRYLIELDVDKVLLHLWTIFVRKCENIHFFDGNKNLSKFLYSYKSNFCAWRVIYKIINKYNFHN